MPNMFTAHILGQGRAFDDGDHAVAQTKQQHKHHGPHGVKTRQQQHQQTHGNKARNPAVGSVYIPVPFKDKQHQTAQHLDHPNGGGHRNHPSWGQT